MRSKEVDQAIKTLKHLISECNIGNFGDIKSLLGNYVSIPEQNKAIEKVLNYIYELEEEIERQKAINIFINKENIDDKYEQALEKVMTKFLNDNVENDFISKNKIRDKIKEIEENPNNPYQKVMASQIDASLISCLKELLGE